MELHVGQKAAGNATFSAESVTTFAELTGDHNPLHFDEAFAAKTPFKKLVVQGGLTTGVLNALVATDMPGPDTTFMNQNWRITAPVFIGDTIAAEADALEVHQTKLVTKLKIVVKRQNGDVVLQGEAWCYTFSPED